MAGSRLAGISAHIGFAATTRDLSVSRKSVKRFYGNDMLQQEAMSRKSVQRFYGNDMRQQESMSRKSA
ncbi:hypothetical protein RvVAR0630_09910 [Agrobacterium vitis]|nr:hypothetical protein RvVAR0630_09910 [Agrobacterium vitis]